MRRSNRFESTNEILERRELFNAITFNDASGEVSVAGTNNDDDISITRLGDFTLVIEVDENNEIVQLFTYQNAQALFRCSRLKRHR